MSFAFCAEATFHATAAQGIISTQQFSNLTPLLQQLFLAIASCVPQQTPAPT